MLTRHIPAHLDISLILRGFFASAVVFWHTAGYANTEAMLSPFNVSGRLSVWMFFGLSGYVIGYGFFSDKYRMNLSGLKFYWRRRFLRILPLFLLITGLYYAIQLANGASWSTFLSAIPQSVLTLQWQHVNYPIGVFWTLGVELHFYVIAPVIAWVWIATDRFAILIALLTYLTLWGWNGDTADSRSMLGNLHHFTLGMMMAKLYLTGRLDRLLTKPLLMGAIVCLSVFMILVANVMYFYNNFWSYGGSLSAGFALAGLLCVHCYVERREIDPGIVGKGLMWVGVLAYGIYAWHGAILVIWPDLVNHFVLVYAISATLALASFLMLEAPIQRAFRGKLQHD